MNSKSRRSFIVLIRCCDLVLSLANIGLVYQVTVHPFLPLWRVAGTKLRVTSRSPNYVQEDRSKSLLRSSGLPRNTKFLLTQFGAQATDMLAQYGRVSHHNVHCGVLVRSYKHRGFQVQSGAHRVQFVYNTALIRSIAYGIRFSIQC